MLLFYVTAFILAYPGTSWADSLLDPGLQSEQKKIKAIKTIKANYVARAWAEGSGYQNKSKYKQIKQNNNYKS